MAKCGSLTSAGTREERAGGRGQGGERRQTEVEWGGRLGRWMRRDDRR